MLAERLQEVKRMRRVSDMLCSCHAALRDRCNARASLLDMLILASSTWIVALSFVEPRLEVRLTPFKWDSQIWVGSLGIVTFFLTIVQMKVDWKSRAEGHKRTFETYAETKNIATRLLANDGDLEELYRHLVSMYNLAASLGVPVPEKDFLAQKRRHIIKVELSKHLDNHPSSSILLLRLRLWWSDNVGVKVKQ